MAFTTGAGSSDIKTGIFLYGVPFLEVHREVEGSESLIDLLNGEAQAATTRHQSLDNTWVVLIDTTGPDGVDGLEYIATVDTRLQAEILAGLLRVRFSHANAASVAAQQGTAS